MGALDINIFYFLNNLAGRSSFLDGLFIFFANYFQYFLILVFLLFLVFSRYSKREKYYIFWVSAISVAISRFGITEIIRFFYHRPRPFMIFSVHQLISETEWSFPSGHATFFFALSVAIYFYNKKLGIAFFVASILMTISRVIAGVHYPSDIFGGAIIGIATAYIVFRFSEKIKIGNVIK